MIEIAIPTAVRMDAIVTPCFRNRVRMRSTSIVSSWRIRLNVSRILLIWDRRSALFAERASSLDSLSIFMSESSRSKFLDSISYLLLNFVSVSFLCSWAQCFSTSDSRSSNLDSFARLFTISSLIPVITFFNPASSLALGGGEVGPTRCQAAEVRMDAIVTPCFRNRVRMRSTSIVSSWRIRLNVSRILLIWDRRAALFAERASSLDSLSIFMSESSRSKFLDSISYLLLNFVSVSFLCSWAQCFSTSDSRSSNLDSFARLFTISSLIPVITFFNPASSLALGGGRWDPRDVKRLIINWCQRFGLFFIHGGLSLFCATKSAADYAREVMEFDVLNIASATTKGFVCLSECSLSSAT